MTSRYCYCPMTSKRLCRRVSIMTRLRRYFKRREEPDMFPICGYEQPIYPGK